MRKWILLAVTVVFLSEAYGQSKDSIQYYVNYATTGIVNKTETSHSHVFNQILRGDVKKDKFTLATFLSWIYGKQNKITSNNDFSSTLDVDYTIDSSGFEVWVLGNYEKSYSLKINNRLQVGSGVSYDFINNERTRINISDGILYESSNLKLSDTLNDTYSTWRNSLRLKYRFHIGEIITINGIHFLQNSFQYKSDYILKTNLALSVKLYKWLSLTSALTYNRLNRLSRENTLLTVGVAFEKYF